MEILELFKTLGTTSAIVTGTVWLARELFGQVLSKDLEKFKSSLEKEAIKFKIRYEKLHIERAEVIKESYRRLATAYGNLHTLMCPGRFVGEPPLEENAKEAAEATNDLTAYYEGNRIFFEESLATEIDNLLKIFKNSWYNFHAYQESGDLKEPGSGQKRYEAWKEISEEGLRVKRLIEGKFRSILGIENHTKA